MPNIKLKTGNLEFELEGDESFIARQLTDLPILLEKLVKKGAPISPAAPAAGSGADGKEAKSGSVREGTINTATAKLGGNTCRDVFVAAAAHLGLFQGKERFTDEEWEETAKESNLWRTKWASEKAKTKKRLIGSVFVIENAAGVYSLSPQARGELEAKLAQ